MNINLTTFKRPLLIFGYGINYCREEARGFIQRHQIPFALTWGAIDLLPTDHPLNVGGFGTHANRAPNFAVQNADFILSVGTRLDSKSTGTPVESFARAAEIVMVDIDPAEIRKFDNILNIKGLNIEAAKFLETTMEVPDCLEWLEIINGWKRRYPVDDSQPYRIVEYLSQVISPETIIVSDTGHSLAWMMQAFRFRGQRFIHAFNMTPMGYGLPAAIGASFANPGVPVALITGDGGLQVNIQEMATISHHKLPITIYLFNNKGHGMCRQTQDQWLGSEYYSTSEAGGLACPDFKAIADAYKVKLHEFELPLDSQLIPQVRFGRPNEDADPLLPREVLREEMLIPLHPNSISD